MQYPAYHWYPEKLLLSHVMDIPAYICAKKHRIPVAHMISRYDYRAFNGNIFYSFNPGAEKYAIYILKDVF